MYQVETGIPVPTNRATQPRDSKYPLESMEIGDSFVFPSGDINTVRAACSRWLTRWRPEVGVRVVDNGDGTARLWLKPRRKHGQNQSQNEN